MKLVFAWNPETDFCVVYLIKTSLIDPSYWVWDSPYCYSARKQVEVPPWSSLSRLCELQDAIWDEQVEVISTDFLLLTLPSLFIFTSIMILLKMIIPKIIVERLASAFSSFLFMYQFCTDLLSWTLSSFVLNILGLNPKCVLYRKFLTWRKSCFFNVSGGNLYSCLNSLSMNLVKIWPRPISLI